MEILDRLRLEGRVIKSAPFSFLVFLGVGLTMGYVAARWYDAKQLADATGQSARYQVALGLQPGSPGALVVLTNQELAARTQSLVAELRALSKDLDFKATEIAKRKDAGKIDQKEAAQETMAAAKDVSETFDENLASDAFNVENELRKRLSPDAMSHVVRLPALTINGDLNARVTLMDLMRGGTFDSFYIGRLADEMEEMAKLLPQDSH